MNVLPPLLIAMALAMSAHAADSPDARDAADAAIAAGDTARARQLLETALAAEPTDAWVRFDLSRLMRDAGEPQAADALMRAGGELVPTDDDMSFAEALYFNGADQPETARAALARIPAAGQTPKVRRLYNTIAVDEHLRAARASADRGDQAGARRELERARALDPDSASVAVRSGWIAMAASDYDAAGEHFRDAIRHEQRDGDSPDDSAGRRGLAYLENRRDGRIESGIEHFDKPGDAGISQMTSVIAPLEARWPVGYRGHVFLHLDGIDLDAGRVPIENLADSAEYGALLALGPGGGDPEQDARGVMPGLGYEGDHWRADVGATPSGFEHSNMVGGLRYDRWLEDHSLGFDLSRRPVTSSLVSFAGAEDPASGRIWGGVVATGLRARGSRRIDDWNLFGNAGWHRLTGRNVPDNDWLSLRVGIDRDWLQTPAHTLTAGLAATWWAYDKNQRFYTLGHGGYYSPQAYVALALPFEWSGRQERLSFRVRGGGAVSLSDEDDVDFHPTDSALQSAAALAAAANNLGDARHDGGAGGGFGWYLGGAVEYRLTPHWSVGARTAIDRSEYYTPDTFGLYLRWHFASRDGDVPLPDPPTPYALY